jgi:multidrug efflux pump subunit AcrA (membrane-fusion protein)
MILSGGVAQVRVVGSGNIVSERLITYIDWPAEVVIVTSGLKPGDRILVDPNSVQLGQSVRVSG